MLGLLATGTFLYSLFVKVFPIIPLGHHGEVPLASVVPEAPRPRMRTAAAVLTLVTGVTLAVVGFAASARMGTRYFLDPVIPFAPVVFIAGVITTFMSSAVYEVFPGERKGKGASPVSPQGEQPANAA